MAGQQQNQGQVLLKTSFFGGFDKGEVLTYIDRLREQNQAMAVDLEGQLAEMAKARGELTDQVLGFEGKITEVERQLDASSDRIRELTGMVETLKGTLAEQQREGDAKDREIRTQKEQTRQLSLRAQNYEYKAKRYEELSAQMGDILLETRQDAGKLLQQAEQEAVQIKSAAVTASEQISKEMRLMRGDLVTMREHIAGLMTSMNQRLDEIDHMIQTADADFSAWKPKQEQSKADLQGEAPETPQQAAEPEAVAPIEFFRDAANG